MNSLRWQSLVQEYLFQIVVLCVGVIGIFVSFWLFSDNGNTFSVVSGIAGSFVSSSIVATGSIMVFQKHSRRKEVCDKWALDGIYELRQEVNISLNNYQDNAKNQIDIMAMGLSSWINARQGKIEQALKHGVSIRIITLHPENPYLNVIDDRENKAHGTTKKSITNLASRVTFLQQYGNIAIKYHMELPLDMYFRVDRHMFVGSYLHGKESQQTITYEYSQGGKGFEYYEKYFDSLWNNRTSPRINYVEYHKKDYSDG